MIKLSENTWANIDSAEVVLVEVNAIGFEDLKENAYYYVVVTLRDGNEIKSDAFKTIEEARACAENFASALKENE